MFFSVPISLLLPLLRIYVSNIYLYIVVVVFAAVDVEG